MTASLSVADMLEGAFASPASRIITCPELLEKTFPEPRWAVRGMIPEGLSFLVGGPKYGKSWFALLIALAMAQGGVALGKIPVEQGPVLFLGLEDNERRLQDRIVRLLDGESPPSDLHLVTEWPRIDEGAIEALAGWLKQHPTTRAVYIDVVARLRSPSAPTANQYQHDYEVAAKLKRLADDHHVAIVGLHHTRKQAADDPFDRISGTNGLAGAADAVMVLTREPGRADAVLYVRGRDVPEAEHALSFDPVLCRWSLLGEAAEWRLTDNRAAIVEALRTHGPMKPVQLADVLDANRGTIRSTLHRMRLDHQVEERTGVYSLPVATPATPATVREVTPLFPVAVDFRGATNRQACNRAATGKTHGTARSVAPVAGVAPPATERPSTAGEEALL